MIKFVNLSYKLSILVFVGSQLQALLKWPRPLPLEEERIRLLHEVGFELERSFNGEAINLVKSSNKSAQTLVSLITQHFPGRF